MREREREKEREKGDRRENGRKGMETEIKREVVRKNGGGKKEKEERRKERGKAMLWEGGRWTRPSHLKSALWGAAVLVLAFVGPEL